VDKELAGKDGFVLLHIHYKGEWSWDDNKDTYDKKRSIITQINGRHTWDDSRDPRENFFKKCENLDKWREDSGTPIFGNKVTRAEWNWRDDSHFPDSLKEYATCLRYLLKEGEACKKVVRKKYIDASTANFGTTTNGGSTGPDDPDAIWIEPDWTALQLATPSRSPLSFTILFVGVNGNEKADLNLKEEYKKIQSALEKYSKRSVKHEIRLSRVAYSSWKDVILEIQRVEPTIVQFGYHSQESGLELFGQTVRPQEMIPVNVESRTRGRAEIRLIVLNACESDGHAKKL